MSINALFDIGKKSLFASQTGISVVGNNISNVNTEGYSRQAVVLEDGLYIRTSAGQLGTGVEATQIIRYFDEYIEGRLNSKTAEEMRWSALYENLQNVERILTEANSKGIGHALNQFWADWQNLATDPRSGSIRTSLLSNTSTLLGALHSAENSLAVLQQGADNAIAREVTEINEILVGIAALNAQISGVETNHGQHANGLRDERAMLVRQLAEKMDITYIDNGMGKVTILTQAGHTLVDGTNYFRLAFEGPQTLPELTSASTFDGTIEFQGQSSTEYTIEIVNPGAVGTATYKVSVNGGKTWLKDENGVAEFTTTTVGTLMPDGKGLLVFDPGSGKELQAGDQFHVLPQKSLFWYENSSSKMNITPQLLPNGEDNERRLVGGTLSGLIQFRDAGVGGYIEKLNAFSSSLAWEVNRRHSQGSGLERFTEVTGTQKLLDASVALGSRESGLVFGGRLEAGNVLLHLYNATTGVLETSRTLDFSGITPPGSANFDPQQHSLEDVVQAINTTFGGDITASINGGRLQLEVDDGLELAFGTDSNGLLAALGLNTFFEGEDARTLTVNTVIRADASFLNTGHVNGSGEMNRGDNTTALNIASLQNTNVSVSTIWGRSGSQTLGEYYSSLVALAGSEVASAKFNYEYNAALASDLKAQQDAVSGVNLDEEMTNLIKFQHAYTAAAKLITTADSMMQVLLGLKS